MLPGSPLVLVVLKMLMRRWPRKREFMVFFFLSSRMGEKEVSFQDLVFIVKWKFGFTARTAKNIVKRLVSMGFIVRLDSNMLRVRRVDEVLNEYLTSYLYSRWKKKVVSITRQTLS